ncbi:hypothetical protein LJF28_04870 [Chryseobacterium indologenes]|uniref:hypothetical protein n=1 Tax=Chryseobacterium indologenes TaxID=253 RepID=UPI001D0D691B|nr:hypothetical protein [Chryseobacterium indologenes]UDQ55002.1 hypothetical protein LJF28_04870 [Chryseobacterium indologenes]
MAEYKFIVNTENVNSYGYRILTEGIDITQYERNPVVLFMHDRGDYKHNGATGDEVIGKARLVKENNLLLAYITFDSKNDFASKIEGKVEGGFINMCSMYADPIETTLDPKLALPGQQYETVTKCKLIEISIVDIGGNDDALRLSAGNTKHKLKLLNQNTMSELKMIALALGKSADSNENSVLEGIQALKLSLETEKGKTAEWKNKYIELQKKEATALVDKAVRLGLFPEDLKDGQISLFENDFEGQHLKLSKLIETKEAEAQKNGKKETVEGVIKLSHKNKEIEEGSEESFDYLQKHDPVKLSQIRKEQPELYAKLSLAYANGVRHK